MPRVPLTAEEPRERAQHPDDPGTDHRRLRPDREHVAADRDDGAGLGPQARHAEQEQEPERSAGDNRDVRAAHGEQVVEPARAEALLERVAQTLVLPEDDALEHGLPLTAEPRRAVAREPAVQPVGDTADTAAAADHTPRFGAQDGVDTVVAEPCALVEAVGRPARLPQLAEERQGRPLRRRAPGRQLEQYRFSRAQVAPAHDERPHARLEAAGARRLLGLDKRPLGRADARSEDTRVERRQPVARPPPAGEREGARGRDQPRTGIAGRQRDRRRDGRREQGDRSCGAHCDRGREPEAERRDEE